ncbi:hypothetical protein F511_17414 [Dorcoceras hygrometricum]|uniref:Uncharacterized protein n=1 Tax=Dorcoceras hygrometricum TaxID=472368 RepID=A0A2Z7CDV9_9LAMI|nr:hypothetical protein F511_17414 [Dorcoceras hygrometricum]
MIAKCFNAPELVKEDILCYFGFSRKEVELVRGLADRMGKPAILMALKVRQDKEEGSSSTVTPSSSRKGKRKVPRLGIRRPIARRK